MYGRQPVCGAGLSRKDPLPARDRDTPGVDHYHTTINDDVDPGGWSHHDVAVVYGLRMQMNF